MATPYQVAQQIQYLLRQRTWEGNGAYTVVYQSSAVRVTPIALKDWLSTKAMPLCLIGIGAAQHDPQVPALLDQTLDITLAQIVAGDEVGEWAVIGGNRKGATTTGQADSGGRGLLEIEEEFWAVCALLTQQSGVQIHANATSDVNVQQAEDKFIASRQYGVRVKCTTSRSYLGVTALAATAPGGGVLSATWAVAPTQWDTMAGSGGQVIRYAAGSTAPATPTSGTSGGAITGVATSASITGLAPGTYSISIFTAYCESGCTPAVAERYSDPVSLTIAVT